MSITIHRYEVGDNMLPIIIEGMRNSWESWEKGDSYLSNAGYVIGPNDFALAIRLIKAGDDHGKYLRQIPVALDITAPEYWWKEFDQYKIGTVTNSTSMMHVLGKDPFSDSNLELSDLDEIDKDAYLLIANNVREKWLLANKKKSTKEWRAMLQIASNAWKYRRATTLNYQVLRHMYHSRKNHKLHEWRLFREWIETLPHSLLITVERQ